MNSKNDIIFVYLDVLEVIGRHLKIKEDTSNLYKNYATNIIQISKDADKQVEFNDDLREILKKFILSLELPKFKQNIFSILNPYKEFAEADENYINSLSLDMLNDKNLLKYFAMIVTSINLTHYKCYLLLKYSETIYNIGWNKLSNVCRGKVINLSNYKVAVYPFDKFFNLNEMPEISEDVVFDYINKAKTITVTEKMDGSCIAVTRINTENYIINTNGGFTNIQTKLAEELLRKKYPGFYKHMPLNVTYIFELIHPEDKHIVDYGEEKQLCLLGARNILTENLFDYELLKKHADAFNLTLVKQFEFTTLNEFIKIVKGEYENKEGFVFRLIGEDFDVMFKLKYTEFVNLHRLKEHISIKNVYKNLNSVENYINSIDGKLLEGVLATLEEISQIKNKAINHIEKITPELMSKYRISYEDFENLNDKNHPNRQKVIEFITEIQKNERYGYEIIQYIKKPTKREILLDFVLPKRFFNIYYPDFK